MAGLVASSQEDAAATLGIDSRTLQRWIKSGCPGENRNYVIRDIIEWARANKWGNEDDVLIDSVNGADDVKEQLLRERAAKLSKENSLLELRIQREKGSLVDFSQVEYLLRRSAVFYREACAQLERQFGTDAADLLREAIEKSRKLINPEDGNATGDQQ